MSKKAKKGDCYQAAGRLALEFSRGKYPNAELVHGVALNSLDFMPMGHAWVEVGNTCYDYSNGRKLKVPKKEYYHSGAIGELLEQGLGKQYRYKGIEIATKILKHEHWGPWENLGVNR